ncbi:MAG: GreA/GreB family elongation factor, partial [Coriobacteriales bacterium]|nr:GreA/GreB family elongation factor [Coriobacteriales bacterium]
NESPAGKALIGHGIGEEISFNTPAGKIVTYTIASIRLARGEGDE